MKQSISLSRQLLVLTYDACRINYDQMVETLPSCITPENPSQYKPIRAGEYVLERLRATAKDS